MMSQIPSFVTSLPDGTDTGLYLAVDLGGTNLRVCSVDLHGDTTFSIKQSKAAIPPEMMVAATFNDLFSFIAAKVQLFLETHHADYTQVDPLVDIATKGKSRNLLLGFTFSFAFEQQALNRGSLLRWTKGFNIPDAIGQDICSVLQVEIDKRNLPVTVAALVNDTVGTLLARSYTSPGTTTTLLGAIFGTGTNGAYVERLQNITKLDSSRADGIMVVNTEWGSFDNELLVLPNTPYDKAVDAESVHCGIQMFEKRISGMYLGEILRHAILAMASSIPDTSQTSRASEPFAIDASFLSMAAADDSPGFVVLRRQLKQLLDLDADLETAEAVKILALAIGKRAARLAGVAIAGVVLKSGRVDSTSKSEAETKLDRDIESGELRRVSERKGLRASLYALYKTIRSFLGRWSGWLSSEMNNSGNDKANDVIDIGVDGSLIEYYPGFEETIRSTLRDVEAIGPEGEKRVRIGIAKDGSGVGAALVARMAGIELERT